MSFFIRLWRTAPGLVGTGVLLAALIVPFGVGLFVDPRVITGAPAWLKPLKFAVSTSLYAFTLAWVFTYLPGWPRTRRHRRRRHRRGLRHRVAADRRPGGPRHHQPLQRGDAVRRRRLRGDGDRHRPADAARRVARRRALAPALRRSGPGLGAAARRARHRARRVHRRTDDAADGDAAGRGPERRTRWPISGAHTVGAPDGGPGLPVTGWSTRHGDVRVPHFVGLHAWQVLPLFVLLALRRFDDATRTRLAIAASGVYAAVFVALLVQALRGLPVLAL